MTPKNMDELMKTFLNTELNSNEEPFAVMFFFRNKHIMCDFGTGNNNKMNFVERNRQDVVNILESVYRGATKGKGQVNSPKGKIYRGKNKQLKNMLSLYMCCDSDPG